MELQATASEIIDTHGGNDALSKRFGISSAAVSNWRKRGYVPSARLVEMGLVDKAIAAAGGQHKLAAAMGVTQQTVSYWAKVGRVPNTQRERFDNLFPSLAPREPNEAAAYQRGVQDTIDKLVAAGVVDVRAALAALVGGAQ